MQTQTKHFGWDDMNCFMLDVSMWSGRAKMSREDLKDPDAVPPDALASLGTLKLIDPDRLKIFNAIKRRALRLLESHGVTFLNGFVVSEDKVDTLDAELVKLKDEYNTSVVNLVTDYTDQCEEWLQKNVQWAHILRPRLPSSSDIMRKFSFDWTLFKIQPASSRTAHQGTAALEDAKDGLGNTAVVEVSKMLGECARNLLRDGRETYNANSFSAVDKAVNKCRELAFINPELGVLSSLINSVKQGVLTGSLSNDVFRIIFAALSSPSSINNVLELSKAGVSVEDMGWALQPSVTPPTPPAPDEPVSCPMIQDVMQIESGTLHIETETYDLGDVEVETGLHVPPIPIPTVDSTQFAEPAVDLTPKEVITVPSIDEDADRLIEEATEFQNKIDGVNGEPWQVTVHDILKDLPAPAPILIETEHKPATAMFVDYGYDKLIREAFGRIGEMPRGTIVTFVSADKKRVYIRYDTVGIDVEKEVFDRYPENTADGAVARLLAHLRDMKNDTKSEEQSKPVVADGNVGLMNLEGII